jgi:predicted nucleotidyltransferase
MKSSEYNYGMKKLRPRALSLKLAGEVRKRLSEALGQPVKVIMYGSQARGDASKYSDIDLLVILPSLDDDTRRLVSDIAWEVGFDAGKLISTIPETKEEWQRLVASPFYQNVKREGIVA